MMGPQSGGEVAVGGNRGGVQLRIAARQPHRIALRQRLTGDRREESRLGAQREQRLEVGRVDEAVGRVARDGDAPASQQGIDRGPRRGGEIHRRRQAGRAGLDEFVGQPVEPRLEIADLGRLQQAEVALGQRRFGVARQGTIPDHAGGQRLAQHLGVARAADVIGEHPRERQIGLITGQAVR